MMIQPMIRMLQDLIGLDPVKDIPLDSSEVMSLFQNTSALGSHQMISAVVL